MFKVRAVHTVKYATVLLVVLALQGRFAESLTRKITVKGDAVAISNSPMAWIIVNGWVHSEIIVRVKEPKNLASQFIRIRLAVRSDQFNEWRASLTSLHQFRIRRIREYDEPLAQWIKVEDQNGTPLPPMSGWANLSGNEGIQLPFDQLMAFESVDWPEVPWM